MAFSLAGEKREFVDRVASLIQGHLAFEEIPDQADDNEEEGKEKERLWRADRLWNPAPLAFSLRRKGT